MCIYRVLSFILHRMSWPTRYWMLWNKYVLAIILFAVPIDFSKVVLLVFVLRSVHRIVTICSGSPSAFGLQATCFYVNCLFNNLSRQNYKWNLFTELCVRFAKRIYRERYRDIEIQCLFYRKHLLSSLWTNQPTQPTSLPTYLSSNQLTNKLIN